MNQRPTGQHDRTSDIGPFTVETSDSSLRKFVQALGPEATSTRNALDVPHTFPINWITRREIRSKINDALVRPLQLSQTISYHKPLQVNERYSLSGSCSVAQIEKTIRLDLSVKDFRGDQILDMQTTILGDVIPRQQDPAKSSIGRDAIITFGKIGQERARLYAEASGDDNPIHIDPATARMLGFRDCIAHGMLIVGYFEESVRRWRTEARLTGTTTRFIHPLSVSDPFTVSIRVIKRSQDGLSMLRLLVGNSLGHIIAICDAQIVTSAGSIHG